MTDPGARRARKAYGTLLRLYPRAFRERYGRELTDAFVMLLEARGSWGGKTLLWVETLWDTVWNGLSERIGDRAGLWGNDRGRRGTMETVWQDVRYGIRTLLKNPAFTAIAVTTMGLGIGANTAIFSVVNSVLLEPLPYDDPEELVIVWGELQARGVRTFPHSPPEFRDLQEQTTLFEGLAAVVSFRQPLTGEGDPVQVSVAGVSPNLFEVLGVLPTVGRTFTEEDASPVNQGAVAGGQAPPPNAVVLSEGLWQRRFGGDADVLGRTIEVGGATSVIVGVMPAGFRLWLPEATAVDPSPDLWVATRIDYENAPRGNVFLTTVGRLGPGVSLGQAQAEIDAITARFKEQHQFYNTTGYAQRVEGLKDDLTAGVRPVVLALLGAVFFVLLIACANVANLLIVRATTRERELAVRASLGGGRGRLVRQMVTESLIISAIGAAVGVGLASAGIEGLHALGPSGVPRLQQVQLDGTVLAFTALAALAAALVFGVLPAVQASSLNLADSLKDRGAGGKGLGTRRLRNTVVIGEVALSLVLLIGAGLMIRSYRTLAKVDPGFDSRDVLTFTTNIPATRYPTPQDRAVLETQMADRLGAIPGVESVGGVFPLPFSGLPFHGRYGTESALEDERNYRQAAYRATFPGYLEAMGTPILAGRTLDHSDFADSLSNVVVDRVLAERTWPGEDAVGKRLLVRPLGPEPVWVNVVGVAEHQRHEGLAEDGMETIFFTDRFLGSFGVLTWTLRTGLDAGSIVPAIRSTLSELDPLIPLDDLRTMDARVSEAAGGTRFALVLIGAFGVLALCLAAVGLYGVLSFVVRQRTSEFGVRIAFGADRGSILKLVVRQGLVLSGAGILLGLVSALGATRAMESLLVGVSPVDPATYASVSVVFILIATVASLVPAMRAVRVDPVVALRDE